jgi:hypothetical protein
MTPLVRSVLSAPSLFDNLWRLGALGEVCISFDSRGHQYIHGDGMIYRLRFWSEEEWAALPMADRPADCAYKAELDCWVGLLTAPELDNHAPGDPTTGTARGEPPPSGAPWKGRRRPSGRAGSSGPATWSRGSRRRSP